ncbi:MAG: sulfatase-like hydrolase/transferase [Myxococcales bacterium]|nr:sulfatase-like hydrolase/transferase [Myxococcales bacterium]
MIRNRSLARKILLLSVSLVLLGSIFSSITIAQKALRPNIILIMSDDMGFSDIGCYGSEINTPSLDKLAAGGLRFTQFYNTARCCPTRASLMTGLYMHQAGVGHMMNDRGHDGYRGDLNRRCVTIAEVLKTAGYSTYMAGKWHVTKHTKPTGPKHNWPLQRGYDRFYGTIHGAGSFYDPNSLTRDNTPVTEFPGDFFYSDAINDTAGKFSAIDVSKALTEGSTTSSLKMDRRWLSNRSHLDESLTKPSISAVDRDRYPITSVYPSRSNSSPRRQCNPSKCAEPQAPISSRTLVDCSRRPKPKSIERRSPTIEWSQTWQCWRVAQYCCDRTSALPAGGCSIAPWGSPGSPLSDPQLRSKPSPCRTPIGSAMHSRPRPRLSRSSTTMAGVGHDGNWIPSLAVLLCRSRRRTVARATASKHFPPGPAKRLHSPFIASSRTIPPGDHHASVKTGYIFPLSSSTLMLAALGWTSTQ